MNVRNLSKALCVLGVLTCVVAVVVPTAYGDGILDEGAGTAPVDVPDTQTVTEVTQSVPEVEQVSTGATETTTDVTQATAPVTETVDQVANTPAEVEAPSVPAPTNVQTSTTVSAPSASGAPADVPASSDGSTSSTSGTSTAGTSSEPTTGSAPATGSTVAASPQQNVGMRLPGLPTSSIRAFRAPIAGAGDKPGDVLDDLLDIGNSIGVDQVRGLQITSARGDAEAAGSTDPGSESSTPAPLAFTGIAAGILLAIGSFLIIAGNGVRSAGKASAA